MLLCFFEFDEHGLVRFCYCLVLVFNVWCSQAYFVWDEVFLLIMLFKCNLVVVNYLSHVEFRKSSFLEISYGYWASVILLLFGLTCSIYGAASHICSHVDLEMMNLKDLCSLSCVHLFKPIFCKIFPF